MTAKPSMTPDRFLHEQLAAASPDLLRELLSTFIDALMSAEADAVCGAPVRGGQPGPDELSATATGTGTSTPVPAPWMWRSPSCGPGATFPIGCWNGAAGPSGP